MGDYSLPFDVGKTFYGGGTIDATALGGEHLLGKEYLVPDDNPSNGKSRTGRLRKLRIVRNTSGAALLPKRLVSFSTVAGEFGGYVDGYADVINERSFPVDEYLAAAGVPDDDLFYIVIEGPAVVKTSLAGDAQNNIALGDIVVAATAVTSGATTSGRCEKAVISGATTGAVNEDHLRAIQRAIGRAMTARTTANTDNDILIDVGWW